MARSFYARAALAAAAAFFVVIRPSQAAVLGADGGITLWLSWDNLDVVGVVLDDPIIESDDGAGLGFTNPRKCEFTNNARSAQGEANSPPSCPTGSCSGRDKLTQDIEYLADYIFEASEGAHYLRRVYVADAGRSWSTADVRWNVGGGGSSAKSGGWAVPGEFMNMRSGYRTCTHDIAHHELGHYFYDLPDRYRNVYDATDPDDDPYYWGRFGDGERFTVDVTVGDPETVMSANYPHRFVDTTNASITLDYTPPSGVDVVGEVLTPPLLEDADPDNDGPDRAHHSHTAPFAKDEWSLLPDRHVDLTGVHDEGDFPTPVDLPSRPAVDIRFIGDDEPAPGVVLLLDRSGSMAVETDGAPAAQFVQEAGMYLYHSSEADDFVGTFVYNAAVDELFEYALYDPGNELDGSDFFDAQGATNIAAALEAAIDALIDEHGEGGANGGQIYLMSDGRQTTGDSLWDQVDRANGRGIKINTFTFGNADEATMDAIAGGTSGEVIPVSERGDASELKNVMSRSLTAGRGGTPVHSYKGPIPRPIPASEFEDYDFRAGPVAVRVGDNLTPVFGKFIVPGRSRSLQFYVFAENGAAARDAAIQLVSPSGEEFQAVAANGVARKGRFNGLTVDAPEAGEWTYTVSNASNDSAWPPDGPIEFAAFVRNQELETRVWFGDLTERSARPIFAQIDFRYPLSDVDVVARFFANGLEVGALAMRDDGADGIDFQAEDGVYAALVDLGVYRKFAGAAGGDPDSLRVEVEFEVTAASAPAPQAHYETGFRPSDARDDYRDINALPFEAWATGIVRAEDFEDDPADRPFIEPGGRGAGQPDADGWRTFEFKIYNARPLKSQLRASFGPDYGVVIDDVASCQAEPPARNVLCGYVRGRFRPKTDSAPAPDRLIIQFNDVRVERPGYFAGDATPPGTPPSASPDEHGPHCITLCSNNPYLLWGLIGLLCLIALLLLIAVIRLATIRSHR